MVVAVCIRVPWLAYGSGSRRIDRRYPAQARSTVHLRDLDCILSELRELLRLQQTAQGAARYRTAARKHVRRILDAMSDDE